MQLNDHNAVTESTVTRTYAQTASLSKSGHVKLSDFLIKQQKLFNFRRVKEGKSKPGFPRYKSRRRMRSFDCPKGGFRLQEHQKGWAVKIKGWNYA